MRVAVAYFHAGATRDASGAWHLPPAVEARYRAAVAPHELELRCLVEGQGYPVYEALAARYRAEKGSVWRGIRAQLPNADVFGVAGFSAGGAVLRSLEDGPDPERDRELGFVASFDSSYASEPAPGVPAAEHLRPWIECADRARAGGPVLVMGASQVDPRTYASTDEVLTALAAAEHVQRHAFAPHTHGAPGVHELLAEAEGLGFLLRWYAGADQAGHSAAQVEWGPGLLGEAVRRAMARRGAPPEPPPPDTRPSADVEPAWPATLVEGAKGALAGEVQRIVGATVDRDWGPLTTGRVKVWRAVRGLKGPIAWDAVCWHLAWLEGYRLPRERVRGVDVSRAQGTVDWAAARAAGRARGYARATYGMSVDPTFAPNWAGMRAAGFERGAYGVIVPRPLELVEAQARTLGSCTGLLGLGDMRTAMDVEPVERRPGESNTAWIVRWHRELTEAMLVRYAEVIAELTGRPARCYTSPGLWVWGSCLADRGVDLWVADARGASLARGEPVSLPVGWQQWEIWQRGVAPLPGEPAAVDDDVWRVP